MSPIRNTTTGIVTTTGQFDLNGWSDDVLQTVADTCRPINDFRTQTGFLPEQTIIDLGSSVAKGEEIAHRSYLGQFADKQISADRLAKLMSTSQSVSTAGKAFQVFGNTVNAATGVLDVCAAIGTDLDNGDHHYSNTATAIAKSVGQTAIGTLVGVGAGVALGAVGIVGLPAIALGAGAAFLGGLAARRAFDYFGG